MTHQTLSSCIFSPLRPTTYKPVAVCNEIDEPVAKPVHVSINRRKKELPDLGNEHRATLSSAVDTELSRSLIPPVKVHSSNFEGSVLLSIAICLLKFKDLAVRGVTQ